MDNVYSAQADRILEDQMRRWLARMGFDPGARVVDVGSGGGRFTRILAGYFADGEVLALDGRVNRHPSGKPVESLADQLAPTMRKFPHVSFLNRFLAESDLSPSSYDHLFLGWPEESIRLRPRDWEKAASVLRPGGTVVSVYRSPHLGTEAERAHEDALRLPYAILGLDINWGEAAALAEPRGLGWRVRSVGRFRRAVTVPREEVVDYLTRLVARSAKATEEHRRALEDLVERGRQHGFALGWYEVAVLEPPAPGASGAL